MIILSHRGYWKHKAEQNQSKAFALSFESQFGLETDLRDSNGEIIISHDVPLENNSSCVTLNQLFELYASSFSSVPLALNIKADGLQKMLRLALDEYSIENYFVFDMSVPDALNYLKAGFNTFTRQSEYEKEPSFYDKACGVWLDEFNSHWISRDIIAGHLNNNKKICIVSPELHKREYMKEWEQYRAIAKDLGTRDLMLCTDYPDQAQEFFSE